MRNYCWVALMGLALSTCGDSPGTAQVPQAAESVVEIIETKLPTYTAEAVKLDGEGLTIKLAGQPRVLPYDQLLRVRLGGGSEPIAKGKVLVELADGSQVYCRQIQSDGKDVQLEMSDGSTLSVPARQVASCLQQPLEAELARQWETMLESKIVSDLLVLLRTEALDKIEGVIGAITETTVKFDFDGQTIDVARTKLAGWRYFSSAAPPKGKLLAVVRDATGSNWMTSALSTNWSRAETIDLTLVSGVKISLPLASVSDIDFSFGSMRFLADIEPLERKVQPRLSLSVKLPEAEQLFGPRVSPPETSRGVAAGPGIQFMGSGSITYRVPADFKRLLGSVSLSPEGPQFVPCKVQVFLEDKVLWEKTLTEAHEVNKLELQVEPGKRLRLLVQADSKQPIGDLVNWRQLRFVK